MRDHLLSLQIKISLEFQQKFSGILKPLMLPPNKYRKRKAELSQDSSHGRWARQSQIKTYSLGYKEQCFAGPR